VTERSVREGGVPASGAPPSSLPGDRLTAAIGPARPGVVAYVPLGDPAAGDPVAMLDAYTAAGVAVLEVGIPDPDPWMDGPEVRESMARALAAGAEPATIAATLAAWRAARPGPGPAIVWFGYPRIPGSAIAAAVTDGACDAILMLDAHRHPEAPGLASRLSALGAGRCAFLPWDPAPVDDAAARAVTGYLMLQARPGLTGTAAAPALTPDRVIAARALVAGRPVVAGFGVADAAGARAIRAAGADGVVVGSACIRALRTGGPAALHALLAPIVAAVAG